MKGSRVLGELNVKLVQRRFQAAVELLQRVGVPRTGGGGVQMLGLINTAVIHCPVDHQPDGVMEPGGQLDPAVGAEHGGRASRSMMGSNVGMVRSLDKGGGAAWIVPPRSLRKTAPWTKPATIRISQDD